MIAIVSLTSVPMHKHSCHVLFTILEYSVSNTSSKMSTLQWIQIIKDKWYLYNHLVTILRQLSL